MAQTAGGTYYAASTELVSSWPATSLDLANQLESRFAAKAPTASPTLTGTATIANANVSGTTMFDVGTDVNVRTRPTGGGIECVNDAQSAYQSMNMRALAVYMDDGSSATPQIILDPGANPNISLQAGASGNESVLFWRTAGSPRWGLYKNGTAESGSNAGSDFVLYRFSDAGAIIDSPLVVYRSTGNLHASGVYSATNGGSANVVVLSGGQLCRSTSSLKYKTDVQDATDAECDAVIGALRPVTYKSLCDTDDPDARFWGFIAEEVEQIDPSLVHHGEDGEPEGVQYDRIIPALINVINRQQAQIDAISSRLDAAGL